MRDFARELDKADVALFFYAGHGLQVGGKNYLVPIDAKLQGERDLDFDAVSSISCCGRWRSTAGQDHYRVPRRLPRQPAGAQFGALAGHALDQRRPGPRAGPDRVGTLIAYATQPGNVALDGEGRNSPSPRRWPSPSTPGRDLTAVMIDVRNDVLRPPAASRCPGIIPR